MIRLDSKRNKIILLLVLTVIIFVLWQIGYEAVHARILAGTTNGWLKLVGSDKSIKYEVENNIPLFRIHIFKEGKEYTFPQEIGPLLQPTVIILAWQLFLFFVFGWRKALRILLINLGIFIGYRAPGFFPGSTDRLPYLFFPEVSLWTDDRQLLCHSAYFGHKGQHFLSGVP